MDILTIIVQQLLEMFLVVLFGFLLAKRDVLNEYTQQEIARMLTNFVIPLTLVLAFQQPFHRDQLVGIALAFLGALFIFASRVLWAHFGFRGAGKVDRYATVFSNSVFVGIPIIFPILGYEGILYLSMYLIVSG
ncbi:MAG TPA: AEC family transporter, partial [Atopostipes sp.]|nr:AEC family transporter [Atopostipes sp.]